MAEATTPGNNPDSTWANRMRVVVFVLAICGPIAIALALIWHQQGADDEDGFVNPMRIILLPKPDSSTNAANLNAPSSLAGKFLGAQACQECHEDKFETFTKTSHHLTSAPATKASITADFGNGSILFKSGNPALRWRLESRNDGFYQTAIVSSNGKEYEHTEQIDLVTGSGKLGQTYLYRKGSQLFQLPISYVRQLSDWVYSPGYSDELADFRRPVKADCLVCHATYFDNSVPPQDGGANHIVYGISCERCHGLGADHVEFHRQNPEAETGKHIANPSDFPRNRQIDICGQCHSGFQAFLKPPFSFQPGDSFEEYFQLGSQKADAELAMHASNQALRLAKSLCFQNSPEMTCTTCHDPHVLESGKLASFSHRCQQCHESDECGLSDRLTKRFADHCVECHMPLTVDTKTPFHSSTKDETYYPRMWDHAMGIYPKLSREKLAEELQHLSQRSDP